MITGDEAGAPGELPAVGYAPSVPRPPIGFAIDVPDHWTVLDLDPATSEAWLSAFLSGRLSDRPHTERQRALARRALRALLDQLREQQVFLAAILAADVGGEPVSASATLAWRRLGPPGSPLPIDGVARVATEAPAELGEDRSERLVEMVRLPTGPAVRVASARATAVPGTDAVPTMAQTQHLVPVLDTGWLALLTTSTANPSLVAGVDEVADQMAESLAFTPIPAGRD